MTSLGLNRSARRPRSARWSAVLSVQSARFGGGAALAVLALACSNVPARGIGSTWQPPSTDWQLVWSDEFDGPAGSAPDPNHWGALVQGDNANKELEFYTDSRTNSYLDGAGNLVINAAREDFEHHAFTSARLQTKGLFAQQYGAFEARIRLPYGKGLWPAFWLLGNNYDQVGWPACGEVDILELGGSQPNKVTSSLHGPGYCGGGDSPECQSGPLTRDFQLSGSRTFAQDFHVFRFEWLADGLRWSIDGQPYHARSKADLDSLGLTWVYDHPFFITLNVAVGGLYDGNPDATTVFPQTMQVDYVRVYTLPNQGSVSVFHDTPAATDSGASPDAG